MAPFNLKEKIRGYYTKKKWYSIASDIVFVVLVILLLVPSSRTEITSLFINLTSISPSKLEEEDQYNLSEQALNWRLLNMEGEAVSFKELTNGKPVFVNLWATWCPPCVAEMPGIQKLYEEYGHKVNFVIVSDESRAKVRSWAKEKGFVNLPFYQNKNVPYDFYSPSIPTTYIIDKAGKVVLSKKGVAKWNSGRIQDLLDQLSK